MHRFWFVPGTLLFLFFAGCTGTPIGPPKTDFCPICEYHPTLFVITGFNPTPDQPFVQPTGNGWPKNASVEVLVKYEPVGDPNHASAGFTTTFRSLGKFATDSFGQFGYIPDSTTKFAGICGPPPQNAPLLLYIAQDSPDHLSVTFQVSNSFYFSFVPCVR